MKKLFLLLFLVTPLFTLAQKRIIDFEVTLWLQQNATLNVEERITYDFSEEERHGIYRTIPYRYSSALGSYRARVYDIAIASPTGAPSDYETSYERGNIVLKIGDPDETITGSHTYVLSYKVDLPFLFFPEYDEFYWNVTGNGWDIPIDTAHVKVYSPEGASLIQHACYQGATGSTQSCSQGGMTYDEEGRTLYSATALNLSSREGLTIALAYPKGIIDEPTVFEKFLKFGRDNAAVFVPLLLLLVFGFLWYTRGKDPRGRIAIMPQYEPPKNMTAAELGAVIDERVQSKDISASVIELAVLGYIRIYRLEGKKLLVFTNTDYLLEKLKDGGPELKPYQKLLLEKLFDHSAQESKEIEGKTVTGTLLSKLKKSLAPAKSEIENAIYRQVTEDKYFVHDPGQTRLYAFLGGTAGAVVGFMIAAVVSGTVFTIVGVLSMILSGILVLIFSLLMPVRTREGVLAREHILGFKDYLYTAERDRLKFHNAPERTPKLFDAYLPYAIALGVEKQWIEQFKDIYKEEPTWYHSPSAHAFAFGDFSSDLSSFASSVQTATAPSSSGSGGGGSSGGGFGGGGGGSW